MIEKLRTGFWFAQRPSHWRHAAALVQRKFQADHDSPDRRAAARDWAATRAATVANALATIGIDGDISAPPSDLLAEARNRAVQSSVKMGGAGDIGLLYNAVRLTGATRVVETGVAYGWSSLAILAAMDDARNGRLVSVDMPYPKMGNEAFVGIVVPERFRSNWTIIRKPDRNGLASAIDEFHGTIDVCHYDSDKSWWGRRFAFSLLWNALREGGIFISDDIQDNMYFAEFVENHGVKFAVTESEGKFVGLCRKAR